MFVVTCERRGQRVLLGLESILVVHNTDLGPVAVYTCACDEVGLWHRSRSYRVPEGVDARADPIAVGDAVRRERIPVGSKPEVRL